MRFIGTIEAKVDEKGRAFFPALFRRQLKEGDGERFILRKDIFENCLVIYPEQEWSRRLDELHEKLSVWNKAEQQLFRQFVADVEWLSLDNSGRFLIPKRYLKMAEIKQSIIFIGMDSTIEVWSKELKEKKEQNSSDFGTNLEKLMQKNQDE
ncbi:MAG: division/cell wall cluster transcriptional repressor MraZ [Bacteroidaceae bacterium]|jgi:MraZ protein|nr:division/cell wall cluster transcriptional repressor MraZ [Bacteroidaceae bacterium]